MQARSSRPVLVAHRGDSAHAPENTMDAFRQAIDRGADWIELDLQICADDEIIVFHDDELDRLTNQRGPTRGWTSKALRGLTVSGPGSGRSGEQGIPLLIEVLEQIGSQIPLYLELKAEGEPQRDRLLLQRCLELLGEHSPHRLASFDADVVSSGLRQGHSMILIADDLQAIEHIPLAWQSRLHALSLRATGVDEGARRLADELDIELWTWTVDDRTILAELLAIGVEGICSNEVTQLRRWLDEGRSS